jgi:hypothetical protein
MDALAEGVRLFPEQRQNGNPVTEVTVSLYAGLD